MKQISKILAGAAAALIFLQGAVCAGEADKVERVFELKGGKRVKIDLETGGDITISGWDREEAEVTITLSGRDSDNIDFDIETDRSGLSIKSEFRKRRWENECSVHAVLKVPRKTDIYFSTMGGDLELQGLECDASGKTMGGDIRLSGIKGELDVETMGGDITVNASKVDGKVFTMGGDVEVSDVEGDLRSKTFGGDVKYVNVRKSRTEREDRKISMSTLGGDLELDYPGREVKARTLGGDIEVPRAKMMDVKTMGGDIEAGSVEGGAVGKTMGGDIEVGHAGEFADVSTMGGNIRIREVDGWVKASTLGGDIYVRMIGDPSKKERSVKLSSKGGDIELLIPGGISADFDIEIEYTKNSRRNFKIESDFDIRKHEDEEWDNRFLRQDVKRIYGKGAVNGGRHEIKIRTVNGNVIVRKN